MHESASAIDAGVTSTSRCQVSLPAGIFSRAGENHFKQATWIWQLLPFLEQQGLFDESVAQFAQAPSPNPIGAHTLLGTELRIVQCPADRLVRGVFTTRGGRQVGMTSFLGVLGRNANTMDGVLFLEPATR